MVEKQEGSLSEGGVSALDADGRADEEQNK